MRFTVPVKPDMVRRNGELRGQPRDSRRCVPCSWQSMAAADQPPLTILDDRRALEDCGTADESGNKACLRPREKSLRCIDLFEATCIQHRHAIGQGHRLTLVMGNVEHGCSELALQRLQFDLEILA